MADSRRRGDQAGHCVAPAGILLHQYRRLAQPPHLHIQGTIRLILTRAGIVCSVSDPQNWQLCTIPQEDSHRPLADRLYWSLKSLLENYCLALAVDLLKSPIILSLYSQRWCQYCAGMQFVDRSVLLSLSRFSATHVHSLRRCHPVLCGNHSRHLLEFRHNLRLCDTISLLYPRISPANFALGAQHERRFGTCNNRATRTYSGESMSSAAHPPPVAHPLLLVMQFKRV